MIITVHDFNIYNDFMISTVDSRAAHLCTLFLMS